MFRFIKTNSKGSQKRHRSILLIILIVFFLLNFLIASLAQDDNEINQILTPENLIEEVMIGEYIYRHYKGPSYGVNIFQIHKGKELVFQSKVGYAFWLRKEDELYHLGDDITSDGIPNLVVIEDSGGTFSPLSCYVFF